MELVAAMAKRALTAVALKTRRSDIGPDKEYGMPTSGVTSPIVCNGGDRRLRVP